MKTPKRTVDPPQADRALQGEDLCEYLAWDSEFFGIRIGRTRTNRLNPELVDSILRWCDNHNIDCLYFLADSDDPETLRIAEENNFRLVDIRLSFERSTSEEYGVPAVDINEQVYPFEVREAQEMDLAALKAISRSSFSQTRFFNDNHFTYESSQLLYETWIEKCLKGHADAVIVLHSREQVTAFVTCHLYDEQQGQLGLVAVDAAYRGRNLGKFVVEHALQWLANHGAKTVTVVTQGNNVAAQRLYQKCGFYTASVQLWYHWWSSTNRQE